MKEKGKYVTPMQREYFYLPSFNSANGGDNYSWECSDNLIYCQHLRIKKLVISYALQKSTARYYLFPLLFAGSKRCGNQAGRGGRDRSGVSLSPQLHSPPPCHPCSSWLHHTSFPQTLQAHSYLRAFALAVPSAYNTLPPNFPTAGSFLSFMSKCHLLREAFLMTPTKEVPHSVTLLHISAFLSSWHLSIAHIFLFICFAVVVVVATVVCHPHSHHIKSKDPAGPLHVEHSWISSTRTTPGTQDIVNNYLLNEGNSLFTTGWNLSSA